MKKIKLQKGAWEGMSFDKNLDIFLSDDDGKVVKLKNKNVKWQITSLV